MVFVEVCDKVVHYSHWLKEARNEGLSLTAQVVLFLIGYICRSAFVDHYGFSHSLFVVPYQHVTTPVLVKASKRLWS